MYLVDFFFLASSYNTWHRERKIVCIRKDILNTAYVFYFLIMPNQVEF